MSVVINGHLSRSDNGVSAGSPRKMERMTLWYYTLRSVVTLNPCGGAFTGYSTDVQIGGPIYTTTDCSGNFSFSISGSNVAGFGIAAGEYDLNTSYNPCFYNFDMAVYAEYLVSSGTRLSVAGSYDNGADGLPVVGAFDTGGSTAPTWYVNTTFHVSCEEGFFFAPGHEFFIDSSGANASFRWGHAVVIDVGRGSTVPPAALSIFDFNDHNLLTNGGYTLNMAYGLIGKHQINVLVKKNFAYYRVNNASITISDSCGASKTITGGLTYWGDPTWPDWPLWNSIVINAGIPPNCNYETNANLTHVSYDTSSADVTTSGTAIPSLPLLQYFENFNWTIILQDCTGGGGPGPNPPARTPFNYQHHTGQFYRVAVGTSTQTIYFWRSNFGAPPYAIGAIDATGGSADDHPKLTVDDRTDRIFITFQRSGNACEVYSDDDGKTWSGVYTIITGGTHPTNEKGNDGTIIRAAYVGATGGPGVIKATIQRPGDASPSALATFVDNTGANISFQDDAFQLSQEADSGDRWLLSCMVTGDTSPSDWWSADPDVAVSSGKMSFTRL